MKYHAISLRYQLILKRRCDLSDEVKSRIETEFEVQQYLKDMTYAFDHGRYGYESD